MNNKFSKVMHIAISMTLCLVGAMFLYKGIGYLQSGQTETGTVFLLSAAGAFAAVVCKNVKVRRAF